ncbi:MAG TPA: FecR domain-containing protein [Oculatellaceae cyanobacterium]|jgi:cytochrome c-type biogenesis protein CcmH/NrfG
MKSNTCQNHYVLSLALTALLGISLVNTTPVLAAPDLSLPSSRATRSLTLREISGKVTYQPKGGSSRTARVGDRLQNIGDQIVTGKRSQAVLAFDDNIGSVRIIEDTVLQIRNLQVARNGGRITLLSVPRGLARLQLRRFTNSNSRLEIQTPAGVAGVRGTEFGVSVTPSGKTVVATESGAVATSAQGKTVLVKPGFYSLVIPGQAPTPPQANTGDLRLNVQVLQAVNTPNSSSNASTQAKIVAQINPVNSIFIDNTIIDTTVEGKIDATVPLAPNRHLNVVVRNPLGQEQTYDLSLAVDPASLERQGKFQQAEQEFLAQLQTNPKNLTALVSLGNIAERQNNLPLAQQRFEQVLAADPNNLNALTGLARVAVRSPQLDSVLIQRLDQQLQQQLQANPKNSQPLIWLGYIAYRQNQLSLAQQRLEQVLAEDAYNIDALIGAGLVYSAQQQPQQALAVFEKAASNLTEPSRTNEIQEYIQRARIRIYGTP